MTPGEWLTKGTVWVALTAYAIACAGMLLCRERQASPEWIRRVWTFACAVFLAHVACAFAFYHGWRHADAYRDTARATAAMTGMDWGGGLYFNYLFAVFWLGDVFWWWIAPHERARRSAAVGWMLHAFLFFLVVNGAFVFVAGPMKGYGLLLCSGLATLWLTRGRRAAT